MLQIARRYRDFIEEMLSQPSEDLLKSETDVNSRFRYILFSTDDERFELRAQGNYTLSDPLRVIPLRTSMLTIAQFLDLKIQYCCKETCATWYRFENNIKRELAAGTDSEVIVRLLDEHVEGSSVYSIRLRVIKREIDFILTLFDDETLGADIQCPSKEDALFTSKSIFTSLSSDSNMQL